MADTSKDARDLYLDSVFVESGVASMTHEKLKALLAERDDFAAIERDQAACVAAQDTEIAKLKASLRGYVALDRKHVTEIEHLESRVAALEGAARVVCSEFYQQHPLIKTLAAALDAAPPAPADDTEENMRRLGHAVMDRIAAHTKDAGGPLEDWTPAECPSEVIDDLVDMVESLQACGAKPAVFDLIAHLHRQRDFSARTFGPGARAAGVCNHIRKELSEIEAKPADITEWVDVILLALDGAWRSGAEPKEIAAAIAAKQAKNERRDWPDWRTCAPDKAIEHVRGKED